MLIHSASQLLTLAGGPQRGESLGNLGLVPDGAVLVQGEKIAAVGTSAELRAAYPEEPELDASGSVVMPGFVDAHTHLVWAGDRAAEFEMRLQGKSFLEIQEAGGGILSTVRDTRLASMDELASQTRGRLQTMLRYGTTTAEAKTGYGLDLDTEQHILQTILNLDSEGPLELAPTFLGGHAIPPEFHSDAESYTDLVSGRMLHEVRDWWEDHGQGRPLPFVDVFCETGAFSLDQSRRILQAAQALDFPLKIHADEFTNLGGARLAAEMGAVSADHLVHTSLSEFEALGKCDTVAVSLPCSPFGLAEPEYTPAWYVLQSGGLLAIASDLNPGAAWCESMQFVIALACRHLRLTPAQAIAAATINAAAAICRQAKVGSIEVGKQADILILSVPDHRHLGYRYGTNLVRTVIKKGVVYSFQD
ncbi:MAG: imidazolonepropionase [Chloroflexi bacterium]|nr:imidazolonepropionase [Chloroflexota bacterium]